MINIRCVNLCDAEKLTEIYNYYVLNTTVSYEYDKLEKEEFAGRISAVLAGGYPYIVAEENGKILGYAYATAFHGRKAYNWDCELTVYLNHNVVGKGTGNELYQKLIGILTKQNFVNAYALIDYPNDPSMALHKKLGFTQVGIFRGTGYKFDKWLDMIILEKQLNPCGKPKDIIKDWQQFL